MKLDYVVMGSTEDPLYLDFWPTVSEVWKKKFNIVPVLGLICDEDSDLIKTDHGFIKKFKSLEFYNKATQSQLIRLYLPRYLSGNVIVSDIDMIPLSKKYFITDLQKYEDNDFIVMSSDHEQTKNINQYPMCYVAGNSQRFVKIFNLNKSWLDFMRSFPFNHWYSDQVYLYSKINENLDATIKFPPREFGSSIRRIDRSNWLYEKNLVGKDHYIDSHLLRPFKKYENEIVELIKCLDDVHD